MKKHLLLLLGGSLLVLDIALAQPVGAPLTMSPPEGYVLVKVTNSLPRFDLDFRGGTPSQLVDAVDKVIAKPLNTIIPEEYADTKLPALSVKNVNVAQLFDALRRVTTRDERSAWTDYINVNREPQTGSPVTFYYNWVFHCSFETEGTPAETSIWSFRCEAPAIQHDPTVCRFYQLAPYLDADHKVEDITTTIETGWKMLGVTNPPQMSYHKETKVLIAVGEADKLKTIDDALKQLSTAPKIEKGSTKSKE
jgi:hypothetical protein